MKLRMLVHISGVGFDLAPGDVTERFIGKEADAMMARGYAVPDDQKPVETAVLVGAVEKRIRNRKRAA